MLNGLHIELFALRWLASFLAIMETLSYSPAFAVDCAWEKARRSDPALLVKSDRVRDLGWLSSLSGRRQSANLAVQSNSLHSDRAERSQSRLRVV